jgi:hypothetical protein
MNYLLSYDLSTEDTRVYAVVSDKLEKRGWSKHVNTTWSASSKSSFATVLMFLESILPNNAKYVLASSNEEIRHKNCE